MKSLLDYKPITESVFYKGWRILEYIEHHELTDLDKEAIKATIMDSLVYHKLINPETEFLNLEELSITHNQDDYHYTKTPNISGIPEHIKNLLRRKCIKQSAGIPIMLFIAKPASKYVRYCVYDPNYAVSSVFEDATFYECIYDSPTRRGVRLTEVRPFVEVLINGELYLVDTITNRILKSSWFKETYNMEIKSEFSKTSLTEEQQKIYAEMTEESVQLAIMIPFYKINSTLPVKELAETNYELECSKDVYPEEWEKADKLEEEMENFNINSLLKRPSQK